MAVLKEDSRSINQRAKKEAGTWWTGADTVDGPEWRGAQAHTIKMDSNQEAYNAECAAIVRALEIAAESEFESGSG